jgi:hypothetical protein
MRPKSVLVGPHRYQIKYAADAIDQRSLAEGEARLGECDHKALTILVDPRQAETQIQDTLLHETLHAAMSVIGATEDVTDQIEERLVLRLAPVLLQLLKANPRLVGYLTGHSE